MLRPVVLLTAWIVIGLTTCRADELNNNDDVPLFKEVNTTYGSVRGYIADDGRYYAFLGIPYAAPPIEENRFKDPQPPEPWKYIYDADHKVACPQKGYGDEDCLIVNVFTPVTIEKQLPVLFYIHGGSFIIGQGPTKGLEPLIKEDIIVVTFNYRLGALGFLCLGIPEAPGNAGLKDQVAALTWVKDNIEYFGGNPSEITIYGISAGAAAVELLLLSKKNKGLFQRAAMESGSAANVWATDAEPINTAFNVAKLLGYQEGSKKDDVKPLAKFYLNVNARNLTKVNFEYYYNLTDGRMGFAPCVERYIKGVKPFQMEAPFDVLAKGNYNKVPMMMVYASLEGLYLRSEEFYLLNYTEKMNNNFVNFVPADLEFSTCETKNQEADKIKDFYFGNSTIGDDVFDYLKYFGDTQITAALLNSSELHSKDDNPVYLLEFAYKGKMGSFEAYYDDHVDMAGHADFIKHAILIRDIQNFADDITVRRVSKLIANFVKYGNPTPANNQLLPIPWPRYIPGYHYLYLDKEFEVRERPLYKRKWFWDDIYSVYRKKIKPVSPTVYCYCGCSRGCTSSLICNLGRMLF